MANTKTQFKAAVVQAAPEFLNLEASIDKAYSLISDAAKQGADIIAFPETWLPGYPWWIWLGSPAWGMQFVQRYHENSLVPDSEQQQRLNQAAAENDIHVVMGFSERDQGSLYISQLLIDNQGKTIAARRKLKPTHVERTVFGDGDGGDIAVHETAIGKLGALCCWEHFQPLTRYAMYSMGEQLHVAAWPSFSLYRGMAYALGAEVNRSASQMYAAEGQCFVLAPCATVSEDMRATLCDSDDKLALLGAGGGFAMAFGPDGQPLAEPLAEHEEGLLVVDIDLSVIPLAKSAADPAGHYARPDVTRLLFNPKSTSPVQTFQDYAEEVAVADDMESAGEAVETRSQE